MKVTQRDRILHLLESGMWVQACVLSDISLRYGARIAELRKKGYEIELRKEWVKGYCITWYRLIDKSIYQPAGNDLQALLGSWHKRVTSPHKEGMNEESVVGPGTTSRNGGVSGNLHAH